MDDEKKSKQELMDELDVLRRKVEDITEQKRTEDALREIEKLYYIITENMRDAVWLMGMDFRTTWANQSLIRGMGYTLEELGNTSIIELLTPESLILAQELMAIHLTPERLADKNEEIYATCELEYRWKDGITQWGETRVKLLRDASGNPSGFLCTARNVTERKQAEEALRKSEEKYRQLSENANDIILSMDLDGIFQYANRAACDLASPLNPIGLSIRDITPPNFLQNIPELLRKRREGDDSIFAFEWKLMAPGSDRPVIMDVRSSLLTENGKPSGVLIIARNMTDRKLLEDALRESEARYWSLFENNHAVMLLIDPDNAAITDANTAACAYYGWSREDLMKRSIDEINTLTSEEVSAEMQLARSEKRNHFFFKHRRADGRIRDVEVYSGPILLKGKSLLFSIVHDITERKQAEEEVAQHAKKIALLSETASGFIELPVEKDIYWFIGEKLRQLIGDPIYVLVNSYDQVTRKIQVRALLAEDWQMQIVLKVLGTNPVGMFFAPSEEGLDGLRRGQLVRVPGGINDLSFGEIPKPACDAIEKLAGIGESFAMGFACKGELFGSAIIIMSEGSPLRNRDIVETLVRQTGVVLQRKRAEEALQENEGRYKRLVESSPDIVWSFSDKRGTLYVSARVQAILGYSSEYLYKNPSLWNESIHPDDRDVVLQAIADFTAGRDLDVNYRIKDALGEWLWFHDRSIGRWMEGSETIIEGISSHITERKKMEDALRKSEEQYRSLVESTKDSIYLLDRDLRYLFANNTYLERVGLTLQQLIGKSYSELHPFPNDAFPEYVNHVFETGESTEFEYKSFRDNKPFLRTLGPVRGEQGETIAITVISKNVTNLKQVENTLRKYQSQLRALMGRIQAAREEERAMIAREIHDEMGGALTGLKLDLSYLASKAPKTRDKTKRDSFLKQVDNMKILIEETIGKVRRISTDLRPSILDDFGLIAAIEWQLQEFEKRTGIQCEFITDMENISLDEERSTAVFRIFQESITNVVRHASATKVTVRLYKETERLIMEVTDNGKGISELLIHNTTSLGLLGMRERALFLGGTVNLSGEPWKGTTVAVYIPLAE